MDLIWEAGAYVGRDKAWEAWRRKGRDKEEERLGANEWTGQQKRELVPHWTERGRDGESVRRKEANELHPQSHLENLGSCSQLPLLCVTSGKCTFWASAFAPPKALSGQFWPPLPLDLDPAKHRWVRS